VSDQVLSATRLSVRVSILAARNEVHVDFLSKHVTSWSRLSQEQAQVMLDFFVACALLSKIESQPGTFLVTARLTKLAQRDAACVICR